MRLVRALMSRPEVQGRPVNLGYPVLVVAGSRGSGKTTLLTELAARLAQNVPCARLDLESSRHASPAQVFSALGFQLNRWCRGYGSLRFPRLAAVQVAIALPLDGGDRPAARRQVLLALEQRRRLDTVAQILETAAGDALAAAQLPAEVPAGLLTRLAGALVHGASSWRWSRPIVLGRYLSWFSHQDRGQSADREQEAALDALVDANSWAADPENEDAQDLLDQLLCGAFLADLRAEFGTRRGEEWSLNCVVLLDNADTPLGRRFLDRLTEARSTGAPDPLTVLATSRGELLDLLDEDQIATVDPGGRTQQEIEREVQRCLAGRPRWLSSQLPDLTEPEIRDLLADGDHRAADDRRTAQTIHRFTGGHPAAARLLVDALHANAKDRPTVAELLTRQEPHGLQRPQRLCVADRMLHGLLQDHPGELDFPALTAADDLVTCAAARTENDGLWLAGQKAFRTRDRTSLAGIRAAKLWSGSGNLLRRLLLHRLARRSADHKADWPTVFEALRRHAPPGSAAARHYLLAAGELSAVVAAETKRLAEVDTVQWLAELREVTQAPNRLPHREYAVDEAGKLLGDLDLPEPAQSTAGLILTLWLAHDPLHRAKRGELYEAIATYLTNLATSPIGAPTPLLDEAHRYHRLAGKA